MPRNRALAALALACLLVLAGCAGGGNDGATQAALDGGDGNEMGTAAPEATNADADDATGGAQAAGDRLWIYTANARLRVDDFETTRANLSTTLADHGGYVGSSRVSTTERNNETYHDARIVYRVPSENYSAFTAAVREEGTVVNFEEDARDVTGQHADLEARLENLRAERDRLRELYEQANDTQDVLAVQRELSDVQGEIEATEARLESLDNQIAYATVTVEFHEERPDVEYDPDRWYDTGVIDAFLESVDGALVALRAAVVGLAYALPYLIAFGVPLVGLALVARRLFGGGLPSIRGGNGAGDEAEVDEESEPSAGDRDE
ncbi:hypothetical protein JCM30237_04140 [Halolamina litorea]|uniref:DUF4349 domain-containing protein n=1 Tax=Halolamina litorea TaxID=1515593 RepID=A0ABD6BPB4_9EURY|nr:DUF4349 domain-containing protein [Halolamina litorea]